jgi:SRSO17 transposase
MEARYEIRKKEILLDAQVDTAEFENALIRLANFVRPFAQLTGRIELQKHCLTAIKGLLSDLKRKNTESVAYRHGQHRRALQRFVGEAEWEHEPILQKLSGHVGDKIGQANGVIVFDPTAFEKCGKKSAGVARQWLGRFGKVDNGQVGVFMAYATDKQYGLCNARLFLPQEWTDNKSRCKAAGIPEHACAKHKSRGQLCLEMLEQSGKFLPHAWITGDDELGRPTWFRRALRQRNEQYILGVPSNILIRDLEDAPPYSGRGRKPAGAFLSVEKWGDALDKGSWKKITVRDGEKRRMVMKIAAGRVLAITERGKQGSGQEELLVVTQRPEGKGVRHDYYLSNASPDESLAELARVINAEHRIEECFKRAKSEAGLADYECRTWKGWHHHITLSLLATWFLTLEVLEKKTPALTQCADGTLNHCHVFASALYAQAHRLGAHNASTDIRTP